MHDEASQVQLGEEEKDSIGELNCYLYEKNDHSNPLISNKGRVPVTESALMSRNETLRNIIERNLTFKIAFQNPLEESKLMKECSLSSDGGLSNTSEFVGNDQAVKLRNAFHLPIFETKSTFQELTRGKFQQKAYSQYIREKPKISDSNLLKNTVEKILPKRHSLMIQEGTAFDEM